MYFEMSIKHPGILRIKSSLKKIMRKKQNMVQVQPVHSSYMHEGETFDVVLWFNRRLSHYIVGKDQ
jgi:hypothetical protein